jgi:hypothetical protein
MPATGLEVQSDPQLDADRNLDEGRIRGHTLAKDLVLRHVRR